MLWKRRLATYLRLKKPCKDIKDLFSPSVSNEQLPLEAMQMRSSAARKQKQLELARKAAHERAFWKQFSGRRCEALGVIDGFAAYNVGAVARKVDKVMMASSLAMLVNGEPIAASVLLSRSYPIHTHLRMYVSTV